MEIVCRAKSDMQAPMGCGVCLSMLQNNIY
jgi:hypothetical protein